MVKSENNKNPKKINPERLLSGSRIDLIPKILYTKNREEKIKSNFFTDMYLEHIKSFNEFKEDNKKKEQDFISSFDKLIDSLKKKGFNKKEPILVNKNYDVGHGAHRTAASIYFNKDIYTNVEGSENPSYNYSFFKKRGLSDLFLEEMALQYSKIKGKNLYFCIFWGSSSDKIGNSEINKYLQKRNISVAFNKKTTLTEIGKKNLVVACYEGEKWLGEKRKGYPGAMNKAEPCFRGNNKVNVFLLESEDMQNVRGLKEDIREDLGLDKHALHISDTHQETEKLCELFFNRNSLFLLNHSKNAFLVDMPFKKYLHNNEDIAITSSFVMKLYGLRDAQDIDYISSKEKNTWNLNKHNKFFNEGELKELIYNPKNYLVFKGIKFLTLENVLKFKEKRGEPKDKRDVKLIKSFLKNKKGFNLEEKILKLKFKSIHFLVKMLKKVPEKPKEKLKKNKTLRSFVRRTLN